MQFSSITESEYYQHHKIQNSKHIRIQLGICMLNACFRCFPRLACLKQIYFSSVPREVYSNRTM